MAPPKKKDEDKSKRLNFTVPPDMYSAFHNRCRSDGREISKTIQELIELFLNDRVCMNTHQINTLKPDDTSSSVIQSLQAQIKTLQAQIDKIELKLEPKTNTHQMQIVSTPDEPAETSVIPAPVTPETGDSSAKPDEPVKPAPITVNPETGDKSGADDWIDGRNMKPYFCSEMTSDGETFSRYLAKMRKLGELIGEERPKPKSRHWFYDPVSVQRYFEKHPEHKRSADNTI